MNPNHFKGGPLRKKKNETAVLDMKTELPASFFGSLLGTKTLAGHDKHLALVCQKTEKR